MTEDTRVTGVEVLVSKSDRLRSRIFYGTLGLVVFLLIATAAAYPFLLRAEVDIAPGRSVRVDIPKGSSTSGIGTILAAKGIVANGTMFKVRTFLAGADGELRAGTYDLETGMSYGAVIEVLTSGPTQVFVSVTVPEGFVIEQIAQRFEAQAGVPAKELEELAKTGAASFADEHPFVADAYGGSLEGYLFPKTYRIAKGVSAREVIDMMLDQFALEFDKLDAGARAESGLTPAQIVVVASMIEREASLDSERPLVSSVIRNRLRKGMMLEIDATVEYVLPGHRFRLRYSDLKVDSPYNTYRHKGLPPGPICSPGLASLEAAVSPATTDYIYYVLTGKDGTHTFTTNLTEFLKAKQKSKEVFGR